MSSSKKVELHILIRIIKKMLYVLILLYVELIKKDNLHTYFIGNLKLFLEYKK